MRSLALPSLTKIPEWGSCGGGASAGKSIGASIISTGKKGHTLAKKWFFTESRETQKQERRFD
ncbi:hypothetical protein [Pseudomonas extremaustralis]|uniref:hypothetical protein n=1 Tax=Pseudomonas extremaustralis TaxID=359110 RepID=UPI002AA0B8A4|nr:hypothetical protein [Pseudomonas extremaustralis]